MNMKKNYKNAHRCARGSPMCDFAHPCQVIFQELEVAFGSNIALGSDVTSQMIQIEEKMLTNVPLACQCPIGLPMCMALSCRNLFNWN